MVSGSERVALAALGRAARVGDPSRYRAAPRSDVAPAPGPARGRGSGMGHGARDEPRRGGPGRAEAPGTPEATATRRALRRGPRARARRRPRLEAFPAKWRRS